MEFFLKILDYLLVLCILVERRTAEFTEYFTEFLIYLLWG